MTEPNRQSGENEERIIEIEIERLRPFKEQPFQVKDDKEMFLLQENIEKYGILNPLIVRPVPDGYYEIISGHRRKHAAEKLGYRKVPVIIRVLSEDDSILSLGYEEPDDLRITLATIMMDVINEEEISLKDGILHHQENVDLLPANIELSALEVTMGNVMSREMIMKEYIDAIRCRYDYILIDCMPSLGMMTINALVSSDSVLIPVQAAYLPVKGLQQLIKTILTVKKRLNRKLAIEGILLTMVDFRTNYARDIASRVHTTYGSQIEVFENVIPMSVKAAETSAEGKSIYMHCPKGKVAEAYKNLTQEVLKNEK